jgi:hypothetical protein
MYSVFCIIRTSHSESILVPIHAHSHIEDLQDCNSIYREEFTKKKSLGSLIIRDIDMRVADPFPDSVGNSVLVTGDWGAVTSTEFPNEFISEIIR